MYKLTVPEMARLHRGWSALKEAEAEASGDVDGRANRANPHRQKRGIRQSDMEMLEQYTGDGNTGEA
jgi:hypothetical protein